jgi:tetratricopeptide (TPR) repeat protein
MAIAKGPRLSRFLLIPLAAIVFWSGPSSAQFPDKFTNLKVLPKDISRQQLQSTMRGFSLALGVRCEHCHVEKPSAQKFEMDFAADDKEPKKTARLMLQMVGGINHDYLAKLTSTPPVEAQCVTCHHGLAKPRTLNSVLAEAIDQKGIEAAVALYRELRTKYYGGAQYDFGETSLNLLTESLLSQKKTKEAVAIMELSFEANHPDSVWSYHMLAMAHQANGQTDKALADYQKAFELHPDDDWAKQQIAALTGKK